MLHITRHGIFIHVVEMCCTIYFFHGIIILFYNNVDKHYLLVETDSITVLR